MLPVDPNSEIALLSQRCPVGANEPDCPLRRIREMRLGHKVRFLHHLSEAQLRAIWRAHCRCKALAVSNTEATEVDEAKVTELPVEASVS